MQDWRYSALSLCYCRWCW